MIINFSIQNFGSIKDRVLLSFEATGSNDLEEYYVNNAISNKNLRVLKLGLIYGANASGKTTILKALDFLRDIILEPFEKKTDEFTFEPFLFDKESISANTFFSLEFVQNNIRYLYEVELNKKAVVGEELYFFNPNKALVFKRTTEIEKQLAEITFGSKIKVNRNHKSILEANTLWNNTVLGGYLKTNFESHELQETTDWFKMKLKPMIVPRTDLYGYVSDKIESKDIIKGNIVELLRKADFNISDIVLKKDFKDVNSELFDLIAKAMPVSEEKLIKIKETGKIESREIFFKHTFDDGNEYSLPYGFESAGTQRYYQFAGLLDLMIRNETIFPVDELESSLHPDLIKYFLLTFLVNSKNSQLIVTTHHRELLMEKDIFRNDVVWFTEKKENGSTDLYSLTDFDSSVVRNTSSIYNAYKIGKLGATPDLNDYYIDLEYEEE